MAAYFSEFALIKYRVQVEVEYFITLCELPLPQLKGIDSSVFETLRNIYRNFSEADAQRIKDIESVTNHDVKAVEYFLKEEFDKLGGMDDYKEFIHFGLTSQDINNTAVPMSIADAIREVYRPLLVEVIEHLEGRAAEWADIVMMLINDEVQADVQSRIFFQHLDGFRIPGCYGHHFHAAGNTRAVGLDAGFVDGMQGTEIVNADDKCRGAGLSPYRQCSCCEQASGNHVFQS